MLLTRDSNDVWSYCEPFFFLLLPLFSVSPLDFVGIALCWPFSMMTRLKTEQDTLCFEAACSPFESRLNSLQTFFIYWCSRRKQNGMLLFTDNLVVLWGWPRFLPCWSFFMPLRSERKRSRKQRMWDIKTD